MKDRKPRDLNFETWVLLAQTRRAMFRARSKGLLEYGISPRQAALMFMIINLGNKATPSELARHLFREPHSISELVERMEKAGLVRKVGDLEKKNLVRIELTEKGNDIYQRTVSEEPVHKIMASLSEEEHRQLQGLLRKLWDNALEQLGLEKRELFQEEG
jgi:DNA-binding MarR family transcriptional regulator